MKKSVVAAAILLAGALSAGPSWAITCAGSTVSGSLACADSTTLPTAGGGNPLDSYFNPFGLGKTWNVVDWRLGDPQIDGSQSSISFGGWTIEADQGGSVSGAGTSGTWEVNFWPVNYPDIAFAVKGGPAFAMFRMNTAGATSGSWSFDKGLSNFRVYTTMDDLPPPENGPPGIPLPAGAWLLLGGLGLLGGAKRLGRARG